MTEGESLPGVYCCENSAHWLTVEPACEYVENSFELRGMATQIVGGV